MLRGHLEAKGGRHVREPFQKDTVACDVEDQIAWLRFNRPEKRNAMNPSLNRRMTETLDQLEFRDDVGVVVLSGEGSSWSAGMDLKEYFRDTEAKGLSEVRKAQRESYGWWRRLRWFQKPTIAMVNGWCFGGGYGPLFACDLAIRRGRRAIRLVGNQLGHSAGRRRDQSRGRTDEHARRHVHALTGEPSTVSKAAEWKLVNEALPLAQLKARVAEVAKTLLQKNPVALKATKDAVRRVREMTYDNAEDYLVRAQEAANSFDAAARKASASSSTRRATSPASALTIARSGNRLHESTGREAGDD